MFGLGQPVTRVLGVPSFLGVPVSGTALLCPRAL